MKKDFMNTQSAGEGETIQLAPETVETPETYDIDVKPVEPVQPEQSAPIEQPVVEPTPVVTEEVQQPVEPPLTEVQEGLPVVGVDDSESSIVMSVDFTGSEPKPLPDSMGFNPIEIIDSSSEDDIDYTVEEDYEPPMPEKTIDVKSEPVKYNSSFPEEELDDVDYDLDEESDFAKSIAPEQPTQKPVVEEDFDIDRAFDGINGRVLSNMENGKNPYSEGTVADYEPSTVVSRNFQNGYAEAVNLKLSEVDALANARIGSEGLDMDELARQTSDLSYYQGVFNATNQAIEMNDPEYVLNSDAAISELAHQYGKSDSEMRQYISQNGVKVLNRGLKNLESAIKDTQNRINDINNPKSEKQNKQLSAEERFERKIVTDSRALKSKYSKVQGFNDLVDFINSPQYAYHIKGSLKDPNWETPPASILSYKMKKLGLSQELQAKVRDLSTRVYEKQIHDYYSEKNPDYLSLSGFSVESKQIAEEDHKKLVEARDATIKEVIPKYEQNVKDWESKNNPILDQQVKSITADANTQYMKGVNYIASNNPQVKSLIDEYSTRLKQVTTPEERQQISAEFEAKLLANESVKQLKEKRDASVNAAVNAATADYMSAKSQFLQANYNEAKQEFGDKFKKATFQVYRQQVNGDLNMYVNVDKLSRSPEFQKMNFYEKREAIAKMWMKERKELGTYLRGNVEYYPKNAEEGHKHWTEWTGRREKSPEMIAKHKKEWNNRMGYGAQQRYYFYAVDELLNPPSGKPNSYLYKSVAKDEIAKLELILKNHQQFASLKGTKKDQDKERSLGSEEVRGESAVSHPTYGYNDYYKTENVFDYQQSLDMWKQILNHPDGDTAWWDDLGRGFMDGVSVPIIGSLIGFGRQMNIKKAVENYQSGSMSMAEISLVQANAAMNKLQELKPPSMSYNVGNMLGQTTTVAAEMLLTGGVFRATSTGVKTLVDDVVTAGVKQLYKTDNATSAFALNMLSQPANVERIQNVVGFVAGTFAQTVATGGNTLQMAAERMTPQMTAAYGGVYDPLIVQISNNSEDAPEALLKSLGVNWSGIIIEKVGPVLGGGKAKQAFMKEMGSSDFLKRTLVGRWMRKQGFKTIDEASEHILKNKISFSNMMDEAFVEELFLSKNVNALITGDEELFEYSEDEVIKTVLGVGLFSTAMNLKGVKHKIFNTETSTEIQTTDADGNSVSTQLPKDTWNAFNKIVANKDLSVKEMVTFLENQNLSDAQENALLSVYSKVNKADLRKDPDYQKAKADFEEQLGEPLDDSFLEEGDVQVFEQKEPEVVKDVETQLNEQKPVDETAVEDVDAEDVIPSGTETGVTPDQSQESAAPTVVEQPESSEMTDEQFLESMKIPEAEEIQWEEKQLGKEKVEESDVISETENNPFVDLATVKRKKNPVSKRVAESEFEKKYPEQLTRVKEIDANFDDIVSQLETNKLIEKIC